MKIPKKLRMFGDDYKVDRGKLIEGGAFDLWGHTLKVPKKDNGEVLMHELIESILTQYSIRHHPPEVGMEYMFVMNHTQMDLLAKVLVQIIKDNKLNFITPKEHENTNQKTRRGSRPVRRKSNKQRRKTK